MAKQRLTAGSEIDTLTQHELHQTMSHLLREWKIDVAKGAQPVRISAQGAADANGLAVIGGATTLTGGRLGPDPGFWWAVTRLALRIDQLPAAGSVYLNRRSEQTLVRDIDGAANGYAAFANCELLIAGGESLVLSASSMQTGQNLYVSGAAIEMPVSLLWKWLAG